MVCRGRIAAVLAIRVPTTLLIAAALRAIRFIVWPATLPTLRDALATAALLVGVIAAVVLATGLADQLAEMPVLAALIVRRIPALLPVTAAQRKRARDGCTPRRQGDWGEGRQRSRDGAEHGAGRHDSTAAEHLTTTVSSGRQPASRVVEPVAHACPHMRARSYAAGSRGSTALASIQPLERAELPPPTEGREPWISSRSAPISTIAC
jgi:hypothetical protein